MSCHIPLLHYVMLYTLNSDRDNWLIGVRVCSMWESTNPNMEEKYSHDKVLMDEKVNKLTVSDICFLVIFL